MGEKEQKNLWTRTRG